MTHKPFIYSVRRLFSQGVLNDALQQPQTYPLVSIFGNGGVPHGQLNRIQPASVLTASNTLLVGPVGPGTPTGASNLGHLVQGSNQ